MEESQKHEENTKILKTLQEYDGAPVPFMETRIGKRFFWTTKEFKTLLKDGVPVDSGEEIDTLSVDPPLDRLGYEEKSKRDVTRGCSIPDKTVSRTLFSETCMCCSKGKSGRILKFHLCGSCNENHLFLDGEPMETKVKSWGRNMMGRRCANPKCDEEGVYKVRTCSECIEKLVITPPIVPSKPDGVYIK